MLIRQTNGVLFSEDYFDLAILSVNESLRGVALIVRTHQHQRKQRVADLPLSFGDTVFIVIAYAWWHTSN